MNRLHLQPTNRYSCVLDAFAYVADVPAATLIADIGHDGTESDGTPRGFHPQELVEAMLSRGRTVTPIELSPSFINEITGSSGALFFPPTFDALANEQRFCRHLSNSRGVLLGRKASGRPHAMAWDGLCAFDASRILFPFLVDNGRFAPGLPFHAHTLLKVT